MFYKNVLLVVPIWFYGFFSLFSGTQIYNFQLYSAYNVIFTAVPIIWFTTWDNEYSRSVLLSRPQLYRIGLENVYFNNWIFWRWFFYATWQAILMVLIVFNTLTSLSPGFFGHQGSMQMAGSFIMTCVVIVSNVKLLLSAFKITVWLNLLVLLSIAAYFFCFWFITWWSPLSDDFGIFHELFTNVESYVALFFFMTCYVLIDTGMRYAGIEMRVLLETR